MGGACLSMNLCSILKLHSNAFWWTRFFFLSLVSVCKNKLITVPCKESDSPFFSAVFVSSLSPHVYRPPSRFLLLSFIAYLLLFSVHLCFHFSHGLLFTFYPQITTFEEICIYNLNLGKIVMKDVVLYVLLKLIIPVWSWSIKWCVPVLVNVWVELVDKIIN